MFVLPQKYNSVWISHWTTAAHASLHIYLPTVNKCPFKMNMKKENQLSERFVQQRQAAL